MPRRLAYYKAIAKQARLAEAGGLAKDRSVLLLWFLRNVVGVGELEAYDYVCDGDNDKGIDGLFLERGTGEDPPKTLVVFQSKYTQSPIDVGPTDLDRLAGTAHHFQSEASLKRLLGSGAQPSLLQVIKELDLQRVLAADKQHLDVRLVLITTGVLNGDAQRQVAALHEKHGRRYMEVWDVDKLGPIAVAVRSPKRLQTKICVQIDPDLLITGTPPNRVAVVPVRASEVAAWPGISSRELFALNVRYELGSNQVSKSLDSAIGRQADHPDFLSYHNGLTVICDSFDREDRSLVISNPSVVNGAQSVLAFRRGADGGTLTDDLRVLMKVVEVAGRPQLEREVSRRSNTQTGVNARNLMANHGTQLRLAREFSESYPDITYETRPDTLSPGTGLVIKNDAAAQLLCAIFNARPSLAVKKTTLFRSENHSQIFSDRIHAHHILFAERIKDAVQHRKNSYPEPYQKSWLLTRLVACYLVGEILRESDAVPDLIAARAEELEDPALLDSLDKFAYVAAVTLRERNDDLGETDDFKKDFKNRRELRTLAAGALRAYRLLVEYGSEGG